MAIAAVYGLLGIRPIEQELDIRKLSLFAIVMFDEASLEHGRRAVCSERY